MAPPRYRYARSHAPQRTRAHSHRGRRARLWRHRPGRVLAAIAALAALAPALTSAVMSTTSAHADEVTASQDLLRTGWDPAEPGLSPATVTSGSFGQLFSTQLDGQIYAQPIIAGSTVIVATENDWIYGIGSVTGAIKWSRQLGTPWPAASEGCTDLTPNVGVSSTPVYDPASGTLYAVAEIVPPNGSVFTPQYHLYGMNAQTGAITEDVTIAGAPVNDPTRPFNPFNQLQRPGLLLQNGWVYAAFGSHCDINPYDGYVAGINVSTHAVTMWTDEAGITDDMAGIWQGGGGLMSDGTGRIFVSSGNGVSPAPGPGTSPPSELAESVVRLGVQPDGTLAAQDFFSPADAPSLDAADRDFGSGGPVALPVGTQQFPDLLVQAGKDGRVFLLNRDGLGGREQGTGGADADLAMAGPFGGQWGHPAVFEASTSPLPASSSGLDDYVYYVGSNDHLHALRLGADASGTPTFTDAGASTSTYCFECAGPPVVTSNGTDASSAVVWDVGMAGHTNGTGGVLQAFGAVPQNVAGNSVLPLLWSAPIGNANKFSMPATSGGRVYVGSRDGVLFAFGSPDAAPLTGASPVTFAPTAVGSATTTGVTLTASAAVKVTAVEARTELYPNPFTAGQVSVNGNPATLPVTLAPGDTISAPATFTPTVPGGANGTVAFSTTYPNFPTVGVSLSGQGTRTGFYATPRTFSFGNVPVGTNAPTTVIVTNGGTAAQKISKITLPGGPFQVTGLPAVGTSIAAGQSVTASVRYTPAAAGASTGTLSVAGASGTAATVTLTGKGTTGVSTFTASPTAVNFGSVPLGTQASATISVTNTGNLPATITATAPPQMPFGAPDPIAKNLPVGSGYDLQIPVTFTPTSAGAVARSYKITWTDPKGTHSLTIPVSGTGAPATAGSTAIAPPGGGWVLNGSAAMSGTSLQLTQTAASQAGSAVYPDPAPSNGLKAQFTTRIGGGTGADGMTFALLNAQSAGARSVGGKGALMGFGGLPGVAVVLSTVHASGYPSNNFVGIATGSSGGLLKFAATSTSVPKLRTGTHTVGVSVSGGTVTVTVDGTQVLSKAVSLPASVLPAFTASTGSATDNHAVTSATITAGGNPLPPPGGGWSFNATAGMSGADVSLTHAVKNTVGSVVYPVPVATAGLKLTFDAQLSGGTGGSGLTFSLLDPAAETATATGGDAGNIGFGGLTGVSVALVTHQYFGYPSGNFAGLSVGTTGGGTRLAFQSVAAGIAPLRSGTHTVRVSITGGGVLIVTLDGQQILQHSEPGLPARALLAFTGATGGITDVHTVRDVAIAAGG
jgi:lectin family protein/ASPM-SPD-2-Hydin domain-containing protein/putative pyrroloquinoline-quinone-binding quinoprotein